MPEKIVPVLRSADKRGLFIDYTPPLALSIVSYELWLIDIFGRYTEGQTIPQGLLLGYDSHRIHIVTSFKDGLQANEYLRHVQIDPQFLRGEPFRLEGFFSKNVLSEFKVVGYRH